MTSSGMIRNALIKAADALHEIEDHFYCGGKLPQDVEHFLTASELGIQKVRALASCRKQAHGIIRNERPPHHMGSSSVTIAPTEDRFDLPRLIVDTTVDSKSPALIASIALLVKIGAPKPTVIDQKLPLPQGPGNSPANAGGWLVNTLVVFIGPPVATAKKEGEGEPGDPVQFVAQGYLVAAFPYLTFQGLRSAGLITPNENTPSGLVLDHFTNDPPMLFDASKVINRK